MAEPEPDDLLGDVRAAMTQLAGDPATIDQPEVTQGDQPQTSEQVREQQIRETGGRARDESGRFKAAEGEQPRETLTLKPPKEATPPAAASPAAEAPKAAALPPEIDKDGKHLERIAPPAAWKGSAKVDWDRMPRNVREAVAADYAQVESLRAEMAPLKEMFDVNREFLVNAAGSVPEAMRQMMSMARMSSTVDGSIQLAHHILRARGLDPSAVFSGQPQASPQGQQPAPQTDVAQLVQQELRKQSEEQQTQQLQSQIAAFAARSDRPYFNDVKAVMGALMSAGRAKTMDEAYEMACRADSVINAALDEEKRKETEKARAAEAAKARDASRASLRGSPLPGASNGGTGPGASVHDDVRAAFAEASGA